MLHVFPLHFGHMDMRFTSSAQGIIMWATMLYRFETFFFFYSLFDGHCHEDHEKLRDMQSFATGCFKI